MLVSKFICGCDLGDSLGPLNPFSGSAKIPGKSGEDMSGTMVNGDRNASSSISLPNSQFSGPSRLSETGCSFNRKNGRRMRYALERMTFGKILRVPSEGPVSLDELVNYMPQLPISYDSTSLLAILGTSGIR